MTMLGQESYDAEWKLRAIIARINGEWDSPYLEVFGALSTDPLDDIKRIAEWSE